MRLEEIKVENMYRILIYSGSASVASLILFLLSNERRRSTQFSRGPTNGGYPRKPFYPREMKSAE